MTKLRVVTFNARGLSDNNKCRQVFKYLHELKVDIILIQESHCSNSKQKLWRNQWG